MEEQALLWVKPISAKVLPFGSLQLRPALWIQFCDLIVLKALEMLLLYFNVMKKKKWYVI